MGSYSAFEVAGARLEVHKAPEDGKPHLAAKVIFSDRHLSYVTADGRMFSTRVNTGKWWYGKRWGGRLGLIRDAIALGMVPKKAAAERVAKMMEERIRRDEMRSAAREVLAGVATTGIHLLDRQRRELKRLLRRPRPGRGQADG